MPPPPLLRKKEGQGRDPEMPPPPLQEKREQKESPEAPGTTAGEQNRARLLAPTSGRSSRSRKLVGPQCRAADQSTESFVLKTRSKYSDGSAGSSSKSFFIPARFFARFFL